MTGTTAEASNRAGYIELQSQIAKRSDPPNL